MHLYGKLDESAVEALVDIAGSDSVSTHIEDLYGYSYDSTIFRHMPDLVVRPGTTEEVSRILKLANERWIPVTVRGAGTSAAGSPLPVKGGIVMDMTRMNKIMAIDTENLIVIVECGVICDFLNEELAGYGFFFPPDPASGIACTVGGMVANNASGNRALKYGTTKDHVLWLEVVLPTGEIIHTGSKTLKSVSGYDLTRLMIGSEGSLGVITKVCLKLSPLPEYYTAAFFIYGSIRALAKAVVKIRQSRITPAMLEFMTEKTAMAAFDYVNMKDIPRGHFLLIDCDGMREAAEKELERCIPICSEENPIRWEKAEDKAYRAKLISARKAALPALARIAPTICMEDCTVPITEFPSAAEEIEQIPERIGVRGVGIGNFGHAGDGNMHPTFLYDARIEEQRHAFFKGLDILYKEIVIPQGGTITGEHGVGLIRAPFLALEHDRDALSLMRAIKKLVDPNLILNPGKGKGGP